MVVNVCFFISAHFSNHDNKKERKEKPMRNNNFQKLELKEISLEVTQIFSPREGSLIHFPFIRIKYTV